MRTLLEKAARRLIRDISLRAGWAYQRFARQRGRFRVLTYHGLVPDALADRPWVPSHFVTVSQFQRQMTLLADLPAGTVRLLGDLVAGLRAGQAPERPCVCLTFDDGTADNVELALPVLAAHGFKATFFVATGCVDRNRLLPNDMLRLLRLAMSEGHLECILKPVWDRLPAGQFPGSQDAFLTGPTGGPIHRLLAEPALHKTLPLGAYQAELQKLWESSVGAIDPAALAALRMMSWDEVRSLRDAGMEIGAHTVSHVILANEDRRTRRCEIADSVARIRAELGQEDVLFAYPNGRADDYGRCDMELLASLAVPAAVTNRPGWNDWPSDLLELRRNCIGLHHSDLAFLADVLGACDGQQASKARAPA